MRNARVVSRSVKVMATACALLLITAAAATSGAQSGKGGGEAAGSQVRGKATKTHAPMLRRGEAIANAIARGRDLADRPVKVSRAARTGKSAFSVTVSWVKRPPIGIQPCSLGFSISKRRLRTVVKTVAGFECGSIKVHTNLDQRLQRGPGPKYCPADVEGSWDAEVLTGRTVEEATTIAAENGCEVRVGRQDGVDLAVTMDFRPNRLNFDVEGSDQRIIQIMGVG